VVIIYRQDGELELRVGDLIRKATTGGPTRVISSVEGPIGLANDVRHASGGVLISDVIIEAGQETHGPIVKPNQTIRMIRQLKVRDVRQLVVPPRGVGGIGRAQALIERVVQTLQRRGDDPRPTGGTGRDLEFSGLEVLSDGRGDRGLWSLSGVDVVGGGGRETEGVRESGAGKVVHFIVQDDTVGSHDR